MQRRNNFIELAENFRGVGGSFSRIRDHGNCIGDLEIKFVARAVEKAGINAGVVVHVVCDVTRLPPMEIDSADGGSAVGIPPIRILGNGEGLAGFWRDCRVDGELEIAATKRGIREGIVGNYYSCDRDGVGLRAGELFERLRGAWFECFLQFEVARIAERDTVGGVVVDRK